MKTKAIIFVLAVLPALSFATNPTSSYPLEKSLTEAVSSEDDVLENWMSDLDSWAESTSDNILASEQANDMQESDLELESWMLELNNNSWETFEVEQEIEVEDWMHDPSTWIKTQ